MCERLNRYSQHSHWTWDSRVDNIENRINEGGRIYWTPGDQNNIYHALKIYRNIEQP